MVNSCFIGKKCNVTYAVAISPNYITNGSGILLDKPNDQAAAQWDAHFAKDQETDLQYATGFHSSISYVYDNNCENLVKDGYFQLSDFFSLEKLWNQLRNGNILENQIQVYTYNNVYFEKNEINLTSISARTNGMYCSQSCEAQILSQTRSVEFTITIEKIQLCQSDENNSIDANNIQLPYLSNTINDNLNDIYEYIKKYYPQKIGLTASDGCFSAIRRPFVKNHDNQWVDGGKVVENNDDASIMINAIIITSP